MDKEMKEKGGHIAARAGKAGYKAAMAALAAAVCLGWQDAQAQTCAEPLASNFSRTELIPTGAMNFPVHIAVVPDGRVFIAEMKSGRIMLYKPGSNTPTVAGTISTRFENEDGMLGIAAPPDFAQSKFLYAFYSDPSSSNRAHVLSRFTVNGDVLDMASRVEILRFPRVPNGMWHAAGGLVFDQNGNLFISTGDDTNPHGAPNDGYGAIYTKDPVKDAQKSSSNTNDLRGKILRIRPTATAGADNKYYTIPAGNFKDEYASMYSAADLAKIRPEIYAMGLRNPFRVGVDTKTGWVFWGDVGPDAPADNANRGRAGHDEFNLATKPGFYGWPYCLGNQFAYNEVDYSGTTSVIKAKYDCANITNTSPNNTGVGKLPPAQAPLVWYSAGNSADFPFVQTGPETAVTGPMYRYDRNLQSTRKFPPQYDGRVYFFDWSRNVHRLLSFTADAKLDKAVNFPITGLRSHVSAQYGPEGALYMLQYSTQGYTGENVTALIRIDYNGPHDPACFPAVTALRGSAPGSAKRLPVLAGFTAVDLPEGAAGFEAYNMQGKKVWTYIRASGDRGRVNLPEHISGGLLRIRFL